MDYTAEEMTEFFEYLDELRLSGETNMFGAGAYLVEDFGMQKGDAGRVLSAWMKSFDAEKPANARAAEQVA